MRQRGTVWNNSLVGLPEVNTDRDAVIFLVNNNNGGHPFGRIDVLYDVRAQQHSCGVHLTLETGENMEDGEACLAVS